MFTIVDLASNKPIGAAGLLYINWIIRSADFSFYIGHENKYIGNDGIASEATQLLIDYGFKNLNLHKIWMELYEFDNEKIKFLKTLPFTIPLVKIEQEDKKNSPSKAKIYFNKSSEYLGITPPFSVPAGLSEKERMDYIKNRNIGNDKKFFVPLGINYIYYE